MSSLQLSFKSTQITRIHSSPSLSRSLSLARTFLWHLFLFPWWERTLAGNVTWDFVAGQSLGSRRGQLLCVWHVSMTADALPPSSAFTTFPPPTSQCAAWPPQMLTSLTSVGVHDRSTSPSTRLGSVVPLCSWACRRFNSSRDSICSWHALKQSWKHAIGLSQLTNISRAHSVEVLVKQVCIPGHSEWPVTRNWSDSGRTRKRLEFWDKALERRPPHSLLRPSTGDSLWSWHLSKRQTRCLELNFSNPNMTSDTTLPPPVNQ